MRTALYVDGFNLYYGALKGTPYKWLDLRAMAQQVLGAKYQLTYIKYFTARVKPLPGNPDVQLRQNAYLRAIKAHDPDLQIIYGRFFEVDGSVTTIANGVSQTVYGKKHVEKGTDVSLAVHLLNDAWHDRYDAAVIVSNDTDLAAGAQLARQDCKKVVGLIAPLLNPQRGGAKRRMSNVLRDSTDFQREIRTSAISHSQMPDPVPIRPGTSVAKPTTW